MKLIDELIDECSNFKVYNLNKLHECNTKLYHYTNIHALGDILKNKTLRLTKADYMNDSQEVIYAIHMISNMTVERFPRFNSKGLKRIGENVLWSNQFNENVYIISFSKDNDSLTLWSNYSNLEGYNIEFNSASLYNVAVKSIEKQLSSNTVGKTSIQKGYNIIFDDVIYNQELQEEIVLEIIDKMSYIISYNARKEINSYQTNKLLVLLTKQLQKYVFLFKNQSFESERESRMIITFEQNDSVDNSVEHRISKGSFIPYIEMDINSDCNSLPISGITIGPRNNSDLSKKGLISYIKRNGFDTENLGIMKSNIPLRF